MKKIILFPYFIYAALLFVVLIVLSFPITLILLLFPAKIKDTGMFLLMKLISNIWFVLIGMFPRNYNRSKVDFKKSYLIAPNHQSFIDAAAIYTAIPTVFKTLGKKEIEKAPIYGVIYKAVVITVDRSSMTARANSFRKMKTEMDEGKSIVLFPEGTFPDEPNHLLSEFQNGGFALALMQQVEILPLLFLDAHKRLHPSKLTRWMPGKNRAVYLPPISTLELDKKASESLKEYTQKYMQACLDYCRENDLNHVWDFALKWRKKKSINFMMFADVILPLAVERNYTFGIPIELQDLIKVGCRVEVQFGKRKIYSGIVKTIHSNKPDLYEVKPIRNLLDEEPIVTSTQLKFWEWMASYYCCTEGDVMNAALPAHLKLVSDTYLIINEDIQLEEHDLTDDEYMVMQALEIAQSRKMTIDSTNDSNT